jgi:TetR/AcrR family transcriptional regulator, cholesterol catabolism regulator
LAAGNDDGRATRRTVRRRIADGTSRREVILREAATLFAAQGVAATTVRQIADEAGVLSGSLYHHFPSKEAMAQDIVVAYLEDLLGRYRTLGDQDADPIGRLRLLVRVFVETSADHPHAVEVYQNEGVLLRSVPRCEHVSAMTREVDQFWADVIGAGVDALRLRTDVSQLLFHRLIRDAVWLTQSWYRPTKAYPPSRLADDIVAVFLDGFFVG